MQASLPAGATGYWEPVAGVTFEPSSSLYAEGSNDPNAKVSGLSNSVANLFKWHVSLDGCDQKDEVVIYNHTPDVAKITTESQSICEDNITLTAVKPTNGTGVWSDNGAAKWNGTESSEQATASSLKPNFTTKFTWTVTRKRTADGDSDNDVCTSSASVDITST